MGGGDGLQDGGSRRDVANSTFAPLKMLSSLPRSHVHNCRSRPAYATPSPSATSTFPYTYRKGKPQDVEFIKQRLLLESMNPLGIKPENFTIVEESNGSTVAFAQLQQLPAQNACEFRSMVVLPEHRGKDIGSHLLRHIVNNSSADIYLTTLRKTIPFYEAAGFKLLPASEVPWFLWFEAAAGTVVARIAANDDLVVLFKPGSPQTPGA